MCYLYFRFLYLIVTATIISAVPVENNRTKIVFLAELTRSVTCQPTTDVSMQNIAQILTTQYILEQTQVEGSPYEELVVPGLSYDLQISDICKYKSLLVKVVADSLPYNLWDMRVNDTDKQVLPIGYIAAISNDNTMLLKQVMSDTDVPVISTTTNIEYMSGDMNSTNFFATGLPAHQEIKVYTGKDSNYGPEKIFEVQTPSCTSLFVRDQDGKGTGYRRRQGLPDGKIAFYTLHKEDRLPLRAMLAVAVKYDWSYVTFVYTDDDYGREGYDSMRQLSKGAGVCIATTIALDPTMDGNLEYYKQLVDSITAEDEARVILYYGGESAARALVRTYNTLDSLLYKKTLILPISVGKSLWQLSQQDLVWKKKGEFMLNIISLSPLWMNGQDIIDIQNYVDATLKSSDQPAWLASILSYCHPYCDFSTIRYENLFSTIHSAISLLKSFKQTMRMCNGCAELNTPHGFYKNLLDDLKHTLENKTASNSAERTLPANQDPSIALNVIERSIENGALNYQQVDIFHSNESLASEGYYAHFTSSRCTKNCRACFHETLSYIYTPGKSKYVVIGTGTVSDIGEDHRSCSETITSSGMTRALAFAYGKHLFNEILEDGLDVGTLYIDTCSAELHTYRLLDEIFGQDEATLRDIHGTVHKIPLSNFILLIGDISSAVTIALQSYLRLLNIPQISPGSTSHWLDNVDRYPLFLRLTPSDTNQADNLLKICEMNKIKSIGLIYTSSTYGNSGAQLIMERAHKYKVCIEVVRKIDRTQNSLNNVAIDLARKQSWPRAYIFFGDERVIPQLLSQIRNHDSAWTLKGRIIIGSKTWGRSYELIKPAEDVTPGFITMALATKFDWTTKNGNQFEKFLSGINIANMNHPLQNKFWQQHFQCHLPMSNGVSYNGECHEDCNLMSNNERCRAAAPLDTEDIFAKLATVGWLSLAYAVKDAKTEVSEDPNIIFDTALSSRTTFFNLLRKVLIPSKVDGQDQDMKVFNFETSQGPATYDVYNIVLNLTNNAEYVPLYTIDDGLFNRRGQPVFYYSSPRRVDTANPVQFDCTLSSNCNKCPGNIGTSSEIHNMPTKKPNEVALSEPDETCICSEITTAIYIILTIVIILLPINTVFLVFKIRSARRPRRIPDDEADLGAADKSLDSSSTTTTLPSTHNYVNRDSAMDYPEYTDLSDDNGYERHVSNGGNVAIQRSAACNLYMGTEPRCEYTTVRVKTGTRPLPNRPVPPRRVNTEPTMRAGNRKQKTRKTPQPSPRTSAGSNIAEQMGIAVRHSAPVELFGDEGYTETTAVDPREYTKPITNSEATGNVIYEQSGKDDEVEDYEMPVPSAMHPESTIPSPLPVRRKSGCADEIINDKFKPLVFPVEYPSDTAAVPPVAGENVPGRGGRDNAAYSLDYEEPKLTNFKDSTNGLLDEK